jgi:hypothetical protein
MVLPHYKALEAIYDEHLKLLWSKKDAIECNGFYSSNWEVRVSRDGIAGYASQLEQSDLRSQVKTLTATITAMQAQSAVQFALLAQKNDQTFALVQSLVKRRRYTVMWRDGATMDAKKRQFTAMEWN